jgi:hypothetical protein
MKKLTLLLVLIVAYVTGYAQFCASSANSTSDEDIFNVTFGSLNNSSNCTSTGGGASVQNRYSDYTATVPAPSIPIGTLTPISVNVTTCGGSFTTSVRVFIDLNNDNIFANPGESVFTAGPFVSATGAGTTLTGNVNIPTGTTAGTKRMRVIAVETGVPAGIAPCGTYGWGETEDYNINLIVPPACNSSIVAGVTTSSSDSVCPNIPFNLGLNGNTLASGLTYQWQSATSCTSPTWVNIPAATNSTLAVTGITATTMYRCIITCTASGTQVISTPKCVVAKTVLECYCTTGIATSTSDEDIFNVTIESINNTSNCTSTPPTPTSILNRYADYSTTVPPAALFQTAIYPLSVQVGTCGGSFSTSVAAWIDFNRDGIFANPGERVYNSPAAQLSGPSPVFNGNVTVPLAATPGLTKMRVIAVETFSSLGIAPCTNYTWGETEDYLIDIKALLPCAGTPNAGVVTGPDSICNTVTNLLTSTGASIASGLTYQWQFSLNNSVYVNIPGANSATYTIPIGDSSKWYRLQVVCTNSGITSNSAGKFIFVKPLLSCYCNTSFATNTADEDILNVTLRNLNNNSTCTSTGGPGSVQGSYSNFTNTTPPTLIPNIMQQLTYNFGTRIGTCGGNFTTSVRAFIDFNRNGVLNDPGEIVYTSPAFVSNPAGQTFTTNVTVPPGAVPGQTLMRVVAVETGVPTSIAPCGSYGWGETEDYIVNILQALPCNGTPNPGVMVGPSAVCPNVAFTLVDSGFSQDVVGLTFQWQRDVGCTGTWTNIVGATTFSFTTSINTPTAFRCVVTCSNSGLSANTPSSCITVKPFYNCYCNLNLTNAARSLKIDSVKLLSLRTGSLGNVCESYTDWSIAGTVDLKVENTYRLRLRSGSCTGIFPSTFTNQLGRMWIDFNRDGDYFDAGETLVSKQSNTPAGLEYNFDFQIPPTALLDTTGMRLIWHTGAAYPGPCGNIATIGEVEDYIVKIVKFPVDARLVSIDQPQSGCSMTNQAVSIAIKNVGINNLSNFNVSYKLNNNAVVTETFTGTINPGNTATYTFTTLANVSAIQQHRIQAWTDILTDGDRTDDSSTIFIDNRLTPSDPIVENDTVCIGTPVAIMQARSAQGFTTNWLTTPVSTFGFFQGNTLQIPNPGANLTYFVRSSLVVSTSVGARDNSIGAGIFTNTPGFGFFFDVLKPLTIKSVDVYALTAGGTMQIRITNATGTIFKDTLITAPSGSLMTVDLNVNLPIANGYRMVALTNGLNAYINLDGAAYPYTIPNVISITGNNFGNPTYFGMFYNWVINYNACESNTLPVTVTYSPNAAPTQALGPDTSGCSFPGIILNAGNPGNTYIWDNNSTGQTRWINMSGTYTVNVRNSFGCKQRDTINATIAPSPVFNLGNDSTYCDNRPIILATGFSNFGFNHTWFTNPGQYSTNISVNKSGTYIVHLFNTSLNCGSFDTINLVFNPAPAVNLGNDTTICGAPITLDAGGGTGFAYQWNDVFNSTSQTIQTTQTNNFTVTVTDNNFPTGCSTVASRKVTVGLVPNFTLGQDTSVCASNYTISAPLNPSLKYLWNNGASSPSITVQKPGLYSVDLLDVLSGCVKSDTVSINFSTITPVNLGPDMKLCSNTQLLKAPEGYTSYLWSSGSNSSTSIINATGDYWVEASNNCGIFRDTVKVTFETLPIVQLPGDTNVCGSLTLSAGVQPAGNNIVWSNSSNSNTITVTNSGTYWVNVSNTCGLATDAINVNVEGTPIIKFIAKQNGNQISIADSSSFARSYNWYINGVLKSTSKNPVLLFSGPGTYQVTLVIKNNCGDSASKTESFTFTQSSINEFTFTSYKVYPNPASSFINLELTNVDNGLYSMQIVSVSGKIVYSKKLEVVGNKYQDLISVEQFASGEYIVKLTNSFGQSISNNITVKQ